MEHFAHLANQPLKVALRCEIQSIPPPDIYLGSFDPIDRILLIGMDAKPLVEIADRQQSNRFILT